MAASGYTPILTYASGTSGNTPSASNLTSSSSGAELALNYYDGKLFYKDNTGTVQVLATKGAGTVPGSNTQVIYNNSGALGASSNLTFDGTTLTASNISTGGSVTLSGGTANGVLYLNGSKAVTSGSALTFDGTGLSVSGTSTATLKLNGRASDNGSSANFYDNTGATRYGFIYFDASTAQIASTNTTPLAFLLNGSEQMRLNSTGLGIGTSSPSALLTVNGDALIHGLTVGQGAGSVSTNTAVGYGAAYSNTTGSNNTVLGYLAYFSSTTGTYNTAIGYQSMNNANVTGSYNVGVGPQSLFNNTTGTNSIAIGFQALYLNTTTNNNTVIGYQAGYHNTSSGSCFIGVLAGYNNTTGTGNTFVGGTYNSYVGYSNTTGSNNTALGTDALQANTTANYNTAVGYQAGYAVTANGSNAYFGAYAGTGNTGTANTAIGTSSFNTSGAGSYNTAVGTQALSGNTSANYNTALGYQAGYNSTGGSSTFVGYSAGSGVTTGTQNNFFGTASGYLVTSGNKNTIIGQYSGNQGGLDIRTSSNYIVLSDGDGNPRQIIDNNGNVGVGTSSPTQKLQVAGNIASSGNGCLLALNSTSDGIYIVGGNKSYNAFSVGDYGIGSVGAMKFASNNNINMTLDTSGNLGLGVTPSAWSSNTVIQLGGGSLYSYSGNDRIAITQNAYFQAGAAYYKNTNTASNYMQFAGQHLWFNAPSGTAGNAITFTQAMTLDNSGKLLVGVTSASGYSEQVIISSPASVAQLALNAASGYNSTVSHYINGSAKWYTQALGDGSGAYRWYDNTAGAERARIDSSGTLLVGKTSSAATSVGFQVDGTGALYTTKSTSTSADATYYLYSTGAGAYRFYVGMDGTIHATSTSITAISDQTLKTNVKPLETGLTQVMALQPRRFDWINGDATNVAGFIAQEVEQVLPDLVAPFKYTDTETKLGLKMGDMIPTLVKAIQELKAELDTLKAKVGA